jgi:hypothetical protein
MITPGAYAEAPEYSWLTQAARWVTVRDCIITNSYSLNARKTGDDRLMRLSASLRRPRLTGLIVGFALLAGGIAGPVLLGSGTALAGPCGSAVTAGTSCDATGTLAVTGGTLTLTMRASLTWAATLDGVDEQVIDTHDQRYLVNDATGSGAGWHVTAAATTFTDASTNDTLPDTGTFATNGSADSMADTSAPTAGCPGPTTCTLPQNTTTYPVAITTHPTSPQPSTIYDTAAGTGLGAIAIGTTAGGTGGSGANPVGWWLNLPSNTLGGTYTSTITMEVISGP